MGNRTRNLIIIGLVIALLGGSIAAIVLKKSRLGLDLAGGISLTYQAIPNGPTETPSEREVQNAIKVIQDRVDALGVSEAEVRSEGENLIGVSLPDVDDPEQAKSLVGSTAKLLFYKWEDTVVVGPNRTDEITSTDGATNQGYTDIHEAVELASKQKGSTTAADKTNDGVSRPTFYLFDAKDRLVAGPASSKEDLLAGENLVTKEKDSLGGKQPEDTEILEVPRGITIVSYAAGTTTSKFAKPQFYVLKDNTSLVGDDVKSAAQGTDNRGAPAVDLAFTGEGGKKFHNVTRQLRKDGEKEVVLGNRSAASHRFAIVLDGKVVSLASIDNQDPTLRDGIAGGRAQITNLTVKEARDVAKKVDLGALPVDLKLISETQVSASLGRQALDEGLLAGLIGFGLVFFFLLGFYRMLGVIAGFALIIYGILFFALTKMVGFTFTLPGIAGLVLTLSVAADANIVIFERIKEEIRAGRSMKNAISTGYSKGFATIVDANIVTILVAFILFVLATAGVRGFAAALGLGTLVSLFTAVMATSAILGLLSGSKILDRPSALGVAEEHKDRWRFDFIGKSRWFFSVSGLILVIGSLAVAGSGLNLGIDFTGGSRVTVGLEKPANETQVREIFTTINAENSKIQRITGDPALGPNAFQISSEDIGPEDLATLRTGFEDEFGLRGTGGDARFEVQSVGPTFGSVVARSAIVAIIFSLIVIGAYVSLRFSPKFAVPILIALSHDILITVGVYALVGREVTTSTVAALLTILGFSLYDTIIVFDRLRENLPRMPRAAFSQIVNRSMSEVLTRSLATSFVTALPITALMFFGGETLRDFAFALLIGTLSGTYSSIFIAAPVLSLWKEREPIFKQRHDRIAADNGGVVPPFASETIGGVEVHAARANSPAVNDDVQTSSVATVAPTAVADPVGGSTESAVAPRSGPSSGNGPLPSNGSESGPVSRPSTKAERRAARARRKHGR
ncbi:MAG: protein translocase subunit SecD [Solirubrobacterales bacterium]